MSKYDPLAHHLQHSLGAVAFQFSDVEEIVGFSLPVSARRHAAWWSNSGGTHVQSIAWLSVGYRTQDVDIGQQTVTFVPEKLGFAEMKQASIKHDTKPLQEAADKQTHHPAYGALKGMITIPPGVDLTEPSYSDWRKLYGEDK